MTSVVDVETGDAPLGGAAGAHNIPKVCGQ